MMPMPILWASSGWFSITSWPSIVIFPLSARSDPAQMRAKVLLPAPFSPIKAWTSPAANSKRAALKAAMPPKCLLMFSASRSPICRRYVAAARASIALVLDFLPPIMARRQPHPLLEIPAEIELVAIAQFLGDGADGGLALRQAALRLADALAPEPVQ